MFGPLGGPEIIAILVIALLLFGPRKLPKLGRTLGRAMSEFRKATNDFKMSLEREIELEEIRETRDAIQSTVRDTRSAVTDLKDAVSRENDRRTATPDTQQAEPGIRPVPRSPDGGTERKS